MSSPRPAQVAVSQAVEAQREWARVPLEARQKALATVAESLIRSGAHLAMIESQEAKKTYAQFLSGDLPTAKAAFNFFAGACRTMQGQVAGSHTPGTLSWLRRDPVGVVAAILPWNYPLMMAAWKVAPAVAAGNSIIVKPAPQTPGTAQWLCEAVVEASGVANLAQCLPGGADEGIDLCCDEGVDMVCFTGSPETGMAIQQMAWGKRLHLELGGKAALVVLDDADLGKVEGRIAAACFPNAGQSCTQAGRVIVQGPLSLYEDVLEALTNQARSLVVGEPDSWDTDVGPLIDANQFERVGSFVQSAIMQGARLVTGGGGPPFGPNNAFLPTVLEVDDPRMPIMQREVFGPVTCVTRVDTEGAAVEMANDVPYDLATSVWTESLDRALRVSEQLRFGCVWINTHEQLAMGMPHGGYRRSGAGIDLSVDTLNEFTVAKHVMVGGL